MLSVESFSHELIQRTQDYNDPDTPSGPNQDVLDHLAQCDVMVLMGPSGIGKSEQKWRLLQAASGRLLIAEVQSLTDRPPREEEQGPNGLDPYLAHIDSTTTQGQNQIIESFESGDLVQGTVHEKTGRFYWTTKDSFTASPAEPKGARVICVADFMPGEFIRLAKKGYFRSQRGALLVSFGPKWLESWGGRKPLETLADFHERVEEADDSGQQCDEAEPAVAALITFVDHDYSDIKNPKTGMTRTTEKLIKIASGEGYNDTDDRLVAAHQRSFILGLRMGTAIESARRDLAAQLATELAQ